MNLRMRQMFGAGHLRIIERARCQAEHLVWGFYALSGREGERIRYEVKTRRDLRPEEVADGALAHLVCYDFVRRVGSHILQQYELYRICLQDHRLLEVARALPPPLDLRTLLLYVLTHELVHIVRFVQKLQRIDLPPSERAAEEAIVERTTWRILTNLHPHLMRELHEFLSLIAVPASADAISRVSEEFQIRDHAQMSASLVTLS